MSLSTISGSASTSTGLLLSVATATSAATASASVREINFLLLDALEAEELSSGTGFSRVHISASDVGLSGDDSELGGVVIDHLLLGVFDVLTSSGFLQENVVGLLGFVVSKVDSGEGLLIFLGSLFLFFTLDSISTRLFFVLGLGLFVSFFFLLSLFSFGSFLLDNGGGGIVFLVFAGASLSVTALSLDLLSDSAGMLVHGVPFLTRLSLESTFSGFATVVVGGALTLTAFGHLGSTVVSGSVLGTSASTTLSFATFTGGTTFAAVTAATFTVATSAVVGTATTTFGLWAVTAFATFAGATAATGGAGPIATTTSTGTITTTTSTATTASSTLLTVSTGGAVDVETTFLELGGTKDGLLGLELDLLLFAVATALLLRGFLGDGSDDLGSTLFDLSLEYSKFVCESHCYIYHE